MKWKEISCLERKICVMLPEDWSRMSDEMSARKFPYRRKPQEIFSDSDVNRMITFHLLGKNLQEKQVYPAIGEMKKWICHMYPESVREEPRLLRVGAGMAGYFSFITGGMEQDHCHYMFVLPVCEKMVMGGFHFPMDQLEEARPIFFEILRGIRTERDMGEDDYTG